MNLYESALRQKAPYEIQQENDRLIQSGRMPHLYNGFSFVLDRRPSGHEDAYISAQEYTTYFSQGKIPIAAPDHELYPHDLGHTPSYQWVFYNPTFAALVKSAAGNALRTNQHEQFTAAMDAFGDIMRSIDDRKKQKAEEIAIYTVDYTLGAKMQLEALIDLLPADTDITSPQNSEQSLIEYFWDRFGLQGEHLRAQQLLRTTQKRGSVAISGMNQHAKLPATVTVDSSPLLSRLMLP